MAKTVAQLEAELAEAKAGENAKPLIQKALSDYNFSAGEREWTAFSTLRARYEAECSQQGIQPVGRTTFSRLIHELYELAGRRVQQVPKPGDPLTLGYWAVSGPGSIVIGEPGRKRIPVQVVWLLRPDVANQRWFWHNTRQPFGPQMHPYTILATKGFHLWAASIEEPPAWPKGVFPYRIPPGLKEYEFEHHPDREIIGPRDYDARFPDGFPIRARLEEDGTTRLWIPEWQYANRQFPRDRNHPDKPGQIICDF
jgi:hypothetical protein